MVIDQGDGALSSSRRRSQAGRTDKAHQAAQAGGQKVNICRNRFRRLVGMEIKKFNKYLKTLERVKGIEPSYSAWKAAALPLSYTRITGSLTRPGGSLNCSGPVFPVLRTGQFPPLGAP